MCQVRNCSIHSVERGRKLSRALGLSVSYHGIINICIYVYRKRLQDGKCLLIMPYLCTAMAVLPLTFKISEAFFAYMLLWDFVSIYGYSIPQKSHFGAQT